MFVLALLIAGCSANKAAPPAQPPQPAPVFVSKAVLKSVPIEIQAIGNVEAYSTVLVKAQVGGELTVVDFKEGADVKKGDPLFVIDGIPVGIAQGAGSDPCQGQSTAAIGSGEPCERYGSRRVCAGTSQAIC